MVVLHLVPRMNYFGGTSRKLKIIIESSDSSFAHLCAVGGTVGTEWMHLDEKIIPLDSDDSVIKEVQAVCRIIKDKQVDLICGHFFHMSLVACLASLKTNIPFVYQEHGIVIGESVLKYPLRVMIMHFSSLIITNSYATASRLMRWYPVNNRKYRVLYNGIKPVRKSRRSVIRNKLGIKNTDHVIGFVGSFLKLRRPMILIDACLKILEKRDDIHVFFVSEPAEQYKALINYININAPNNMHVLGRMEDLGSLYADIDLFVSPAVSEGFGIATCEAMLSKKPVIVANAGAYKEYCIDRFNAITVKPDSIDDLAEAITTLIDDKKLSDEISANASLYVSNRFSPELYVLNSNALYSEAISD